MNWVIWCLSAVVVLLVGMAIWVRSAPSDLAEWHVMPAGVTDRDFEGGAMRIIGAGDDGFKRLDDIIRAEPRTEVLAGSVESGMITYISRSKWVGFPDYTTMRAAGKQIELYSRLRFGRSDLGVNRDRLERWISRFTEGG